MMLGILQAALALARMRWEMRAARWSVRALDARRPHDFGPWPRGADMWRTPRPDCR